MIELTDLQEDILTLAIERPEMENGEIAEALDCSEEWVREVRRKYEHAVDENQVDKDLNTVKGDAESVTNESNGSIIIGLIGATVSFTIWAIENSVALTLWTLDKSVALMLWCIDIPLRILGGSGESQD